ncbi:MAG: translation initiation factor IF-2 N-terminal domain-containing protein, partial [Candidatus Dadabacteria bacterium]|nr:translation initiation factor IF-2 N-terminal domain-containing protein [Candidatus Dadabacteria bacterium]
LAPGALDMSNVRIYELSKDLNKSNREILNVAKGLGISVKSHASSISDEEAQKIRDRIVSSQGGEASQKPVDDTEKVRVFRSEKGEEVVERRQGERVVIRRKKRQEEPAEEEAAQPAAEAGDASQPDAAQAAETAEPGEAPGEAVPEQAGREEASAEDEAVLEAQDEAAPQDETNGAVVNGAEAGAGAAEAKGPAKPGEDESEDAAKKNKKKARSSRVKPKREEIIDEDTLEELRKAFRTKLPGRKREYLVDDRRSKAKSSPHGFQRDRSFDRGGRGFQGQRDQRMGGVATDDASRVIPFPGKPSRRTVKIGESINLGELARMMGIKAGELIKKLISMG